MQRKLSQRKLPELAPSLERVTEFSRHAMLPLILERVCRQTMERHHQKSRDGAIERNVNQLGGRVGSEFAWAWQAHAREQSKSKTKSLSLTIIF